MSVKLDMDAMDLASEVSKATYEEIKAYVAEESFNLPKIENSESFSSFDFYKNIITPALLLIYC